MDNTDDMISPSPRTDDMISPSPRTDDMMTVADDADDMVSPSRASRLSTADDDAGDHRSDGQSMVRNASESSMSNMSTVVSEGDHLKLLSRGVHWAENKKYKYH